MSKPLKIIFVVIAIVIISSAAWFFNSERGTKNETTDREQQLRNLKEAISSQTPRSTQSQEEIDEINRAGKLWFEENRTRLYENCAKEIPPRSDDSGYDSIKKIVTLYGWDGTLQQNMNIELPYEPETGFAGCSNSAKEILRQYQQIQETPLNSVSASYDKKIAACYPKNENCSACQPILNNSVQQVVETSRRFVNVPKDFYPKEINSYFTTVNGNATAGWISNGGLPGEGFDATPECWSTYYEFDGNGEVDLRVKSIKKGVPDYFVRFIVGPTQ